MLRLVLERRRRSVQLATHIHAAGEAVCVRATIVIRKKERKRRRV
jgi:hypothetical protein